MLGRISERCAACGASNQIDCPQCSKPLHRAEHGGIFLDVCQSCRGVWFDGHEVAAVWTIALAAVAQGQVMTGSAVQPVGDGALTLLDALTYTPDVGAAIVEGTVHAVAASPELLSAVPELGGVVAEAAGAVFEALVSVIAAILEGLG
jgi:hypothetical protein